MLNRKLGSSCYSLTVSITLTIIAIVLIPSCAVSPKTPQLTPTAILDLGITRVFEADGMVQVYVSAGEFLMGNASDAPIQSENNLPQHTVYLDAFWIDQTEITNAMYAKCVEAGACQHPPLTWLLTYTSYYGNPQYDNYPVIYVSWYDAKSYCEWIGRQLPSEAQWEKTARGTDGRLFPWGDYPWDNVPATGNLLNFCDKNCLEDWQESSVDDGYAHTAPVGNYPAGASPYGALDMAGNVSEWVEDWYQGYPGTDYKSDAFGTRKMHRGGSWHVSQWNTYAASRSALPPDWLDRDIGFRCASLAEK